MGDIHVMLFKECPKAVENFCVHSKNGYYNSHIFHRVIKGFMVQTGDPTGKLCIYLIKYLLFFQCRCFDLYLFWFLGLIEPIFAILLNKHCDGA